MNMAPSFEMLNSRIHSMYEFHAYETWSGQVNQKGPQAKNDCFILDLNYIICASHIHG